MELTCELNGVKYLLFKIPVTSNENMQKLIQKCKKYSAIMQSGEKVNGGWWSSDYAVVSVLVPEDKVLEFNNEDLP